MGWKETAETVNEKHLQPWADLCKKNSIASTPLTPYLDQELLYNNSLSVNGGKIEGVCAFKYTVPEMTEAKLREVLAAFIEVGVFPKGLLK